MSRLDTVHRVLPRVSSGLLRLSLHAPPSFLLLHRAMFLDSRCQLERREERSRSESIWYELCK